jgi:hypothetical protein
MSIHFKELQRKKSSKPMSDYCPFESIVGRVFKLLTQLFNVKYPNVKMTTLNTGKEV